MSQESAFINGYWDVAADVFEVGIPVVVFGDHTKVFKYIDFNFVLGADGVKILQPKRFLIPKFFFYQLLSIDLESLGYARHYKLLTETQIAFPSLEEQHRIVGILDEAFESIATAKAKAEKNIENALDMFECLLNDAFAHQGEGWSNAHLGDVARFIDYRGKTPTKTSAGLRLITAKNVKMGYLQDTPREFVAPSSYKSWMTRGIPRRGDVLFTTEAPLGNVAQLDTDEKVVFAQRIIILRSDAEVLDSTLLKYLLLTPQNQAQIHGKGTGATATGIKASLLKTIELSFPKELAKQQEIVSKLDALRLAVDSLESIYHQKLADLEALKKSLLHEAFSGNL